MIIAIDGTSGSGKSSIAKYLSTKLDFFYINSGTIYRTLTAYFLDNDIPVQSISSNLVQNVEITFNIIGNEPHYLINGKSYEHLIRSKEVSLNVANYSKISVVREKVRQIQHLFKNENLIIEGRDITSVVYPNANFKFFIDADLMQRAKRRFNQKENQLSLEEIAKSLEERDFLDKNRNESPLSCGKDSIIIDTTSDTLDKSVDKIINIIKFRSK